MELLVGAARRPRPHPTARLPPAHMPLSACVPARRPWMGSFGGMQEMGGLGEDPPRCAHSAGPLQFAGTFRAAHLPPSPTSLPPPPPCSPTLFASSQGRVFADLAGAPVVAEDLVPNPEAAPAHMAMAHREQVGRGGIAGLELLARCIALPLLPRRLAQSSPAPTSPRPGPPLAQPPLAIVEAQAGMMRRKADASRGMPARRAPCANNLMRRQRRIGQARKQNS